MTNRQKLALLILGSMVVGTYLSWRAYARPTMVCIGDMTQDLSFRELSCDPEVAHEFARYLKGEGGASLRQAILALPGMDSASLARMQFQPRASFGYLKVMLAAPVYSIREYRWDWTRGPVLVTGLVGPAEKADPTYWTTDRYLDVVKTEIRASFARFANRSESGEPNG